MRIGIDFGGTKIEGILLADGGRELARQRIATGNHDNCGQQILANAVDEALQQARYIVVDAVRCYMNKTEAFASLQEPRSDQNYIG